MLINEAVKKALEKDWFITLPEFSDTAKIKPTNGKGAVHCNESRWQQPIQTWLAAICWRIITK